MEDLQPGGHIDGLKTWPPLLDPKHPQKPLGSSVLGLDILVDLSVSLSVLTSAKTFSVSPICQDALQSKQPKTSPRRPTERILLRSARSARRLRRVVVCNAAVRSVSGRLSASAGSRAALSEVYLHINYRKYVFLSAEIWVPY